MAGRFGDVASAVIWLVRILTLYKLRTGLLRLRQYRAWPGKKQLSHCVSSGKSQNGFSEPPNSHSNADILPVLGLLDGEPVDKPEQIPQEPILA